MIQITNQMRVLVAIEPVDVKLGIGWVDWQVLRRSYATWLVEAGADPKAVQAQMRHSRISTTMDIYTQFVPASQRRPVALMMDMVDEGLRNSMLPRVQSSTELERNGR
jgi:hypothetical protein